MSFLLPGALLLSFAPVLVKASALHPDLMGFYRMLFGMLWLGGHLLITRAWPSGRWLRPLPLLAGFAFALDLILWHRGIHFIGPGLAT
ncbi:MAG: EamA/RhaT family transporter, partial [Candidatus Melainabacteria bacterium HGW-Melainabacteria-1]